MGGWTPLSIEENEDLASLSYFSMDTIDGGVFFCFEGVERD